MGIDLNELALCLTSISTIYSSSLQAVAPGNSVVQGYVPTEIYEGVGNEHPATTLEKQVQYCPDWWHLRLFIQESQDEYSHTCFE